jgi:hypothetical protein
MSQRQLASPHLRLCRSNASDGGRIQRRRACFHLHLRGGELGCVCHRDWLRRAPSTILPQPRGRHLFPTPVSASPHSDNRGPHFRLSTLGPGKGQQSQLQVAFGDFPCTGDLGRGQNHPIRSYGRHPWCAWRPNDTRHIRWGAQPLCASCCGREGGRRREPPTTAPPEGGWREGRSCRQVQG